MICVKRPTPRDKKLEVASSKAKTIEYIIRRMDAVGNRAVNALLAHDEKAYEQEKRLLSGYERIHDKLLYNKSN